MGEPRSEPVYRAERDRDTAPLHPDERHLLWPFLKGWTHRMIGIELVAAALRGDRVRFGRAAPYVLR